MKVFLQKYGINLIVTGIILLILILIPNGERRYLKYDLRSMKSIADGVVLGLVGLLLLIAISVKFKSVKELKDRFQYFVGYALFGFFLFFWMRALCLPWLMLVNQSLSKETLPQEYRLVNKTSYYDLLLDLANKKTFFVEGDQRPSTEQELTVGDTVLGKFQKGLLGVNFDPEFSKK